MDIDVASDMAADVANDVAADMANDLAADMAAGKRHSRCCQPNFEKAQFRVGLISAQHLLSTNQIQLFTQPI